MTEPVTLDEFEREYAKRSKVTVQYLHDNGRFGEPCDCWERGCQGWKMVQREVGVRLTKKIERTGEGESEATTVVDQESGEVRKYFGGGRKASHRLSFTVKDVTFKEFWDLVSKWTSCPCCATETALFDVKIEELTNGHPRAEPWEYDDRGSRDD